MRRGARREYRKARAGCRPTTAPRTTARPRRGADMPPRSRNELSPTERRMLSRKRQRMDRLNLRIRNLVQERARLAAGIARWKHERGAGVPDADREIQMLQRVLRNPGSGFDRAALARIFAVLFDESRQVAVQATKRKRRR